MHLNVRGKFETINPNATRLMRKEEIQLRTMICEYIYKNFNLEVGFEMHLKYGLTKLFLCIYQVRKLNYFFFNNSSG